MVSAVVEEFYVPVDWKQKVSWSIFKQQKGLCMIRKYNHRQFRSKGLYQIREITTHMIEIYNL